MAQWLPTPFLAAVRMSAQNPSDPSPNVLLVEDDAVFAQWAAQALSQAFPGELWPVAVASLAEARTLLKSRPQGWRLAVVDLNLGREQGSELIAELRAQWPALPTLVLTVVSAPGQALAAMRAGAQGYLLKSPSEAALARAVREVLDGGSPITPGIARLLLDEFRRAEPAPQPRVPDMPAAIVDKLSAREAEVLLLLARGYTDKEAAAKLGVAPSTIDSHVRKIFHKLRIHSRVALRRLLD